MASWDDLRHGLGIYEHHAASRDHTCTGCGESFLSRNGLFRHLRQHGCGGSTMRRSSRCLLLYGYIGTRFHGSQFNSLRSEKQFPTLEGTLLKCIEVALTKQAAVLSAKVEVASRASRTDRGVHALSSALSLRITTELCNNESQNVDRTSSFLEAVGHELPPDITVVEAFDINDPQFNARYACQKREYWYYVPYHALLTKQEKQKMTILASNGGVFSKQDTLACWVWVSGLPIEATASDLAATIRALCVGSLEEVVFSKKDGSAKLKFADSASALAACFALDGSPGPPDAQNQRAKLLALPQPLLEEWQTVHKRLRSALKKLTGTRSFHNFSPGFQDANDPKSLRSVYRCRAGVTSGYRDYIHNKAYAVLRVTGRDFLYHQIRSMAGLVVAVTSQVLPLSHLDLALSREIVQVPLAPASHLVLVECVFRDGEFQCPFGQAVREAWDKAGGRRGLPGPAACATQSSCQAIVEELSSQRFRDEFDRFLESLGEADMLNHSGAKEKLLACFNSCLGRSPSHADRAVDKWDSADSPE